MTKAEIIERLNHMEDGCDNEIAHSEADRLVVDALILLGGEDIASAYLDAKLRVGFWYT